jgi:aspartate kinase
MFQTLAAEGVNIDMISTSEIKISVTIDIAKGEGAMRAVHKAFLG